MSFWTTTDGEDLAKNAPNPAEEYTAPGGGNMDPLPDGSSVKAFIKEAKWARTPAEKGGDRYVNLRWDIEAPESVARRVVFQKLWVKDPDPQAKDPDKKRNNALRMFSAIDSIAGGKLAAKGTEPTDDELMVALCNKSMIITLKLWETEDKRASGNWVCAVAPANGGKELHVPVTGSSSASGGGAHDDLDDDIPF